MKRPTTSTLSVTEPGAALVVIVALLAGFFAWLLLTHGTSSPSTSRQPARGAVAVSQRGLETLASVGRPIYWAGSRPARTYELTHASAVRVYVRYLPAGVPVGSPSAYLTVGSYTMPNAFAVTKHVAGAVGSVRVPVGRGGVAFYRRKSPTSVYVAFPASNIQIEVFDPSPLLARRLVSSGAIAQVPAASPSGEIARTAAVAATAVRLQKLSARLGRPLYWVGPRNGTTYELTQTPDGRVYVRYLPHGVQVGSGRPYLTVGTYPVANAYAMTRAAARRPGAVPIRVNGGIAFYETSHPTSIYLAFPGVNEQVEVYDPSPAIVRRAVADHSITPVSS